MKRELPGGEVTFIFTDIEDSTRLFQDLGEGYGSIQREAHAAVEGAVARFDGVVIQPEGDSLFAAFPSAVAGAHAAIEAQQALARSPSRPRVKVRMGLHTGHASPIDGNYVSLAVHLAARVSAAANGEQILLSEATAQRVRGDLPAGCHLRDLGRYRLKGFDEPEHLYDLSWGGPTDPPRPRAPAEAGNVRPPTTSFVGRTTEVAAIRELLHHHRLVSVVGPGGIGKTRLATETGIALGHDFYDGAWMAALAASDDVGAPVELLARALGVEPADDRLALLDRLAGADALVILDNCEHLRASCAELIGEILDSAPRVRALVTSREPLGLPGERVFWLSPLTTEQKSDEGSPPDAVALFVDRADLVRARDWSADELEAAREICAGLDGLPLAIELAAARTAVLSPQDILARLSDRFSLLSGSTTGPAHHRSLRATLEWSAALLSPDERNAVRNLAVFRGGFSIDAATAVALGPERPALDQVIEVLSSLVLKSLINHVDVSGQSRYVMLETVRQFAWGELEETGTADEVRMRHARWCLAFAEEASKHLRGLEQAAWLDRLELEKQNLRAALDVLRSVSPEHHCELALHLRRFWSVRGAWKLGLSECEAALAAPLTPVRRAHALLGVVDFRTNLGHYEGTEAMLQEASAIGEAAGDGDVRAESAMALAALASRLGRGEALAGYDATRTLALDCGRDDIAAEAAAAAGVARASSGEVEEGRRDLEWAIEMARACEDVRLLAFTLNRLGATEFIGGQLESARSHLLEALALVRALGDRNAEAGCLFHLAKAVRPVDAEEAERLLEQALHMARQLSDDEGIAATSFTLAQWLAHSGERVRANDLAGEAEKIFARLGLQPAAEAASALRSASERG